MKKKLNWGCMTLINLKNGADNYFATEEGFCEDTDGDEPVLTRQYSDAGSFHGMHSSQFPPSQISEDVHTIKTG